MQFKPLKVVGRVNLLYLSLQKGLTVLTYSFLAGPAPSKNIYPQTIAILKYSPFLFENWLCSCCKESALYYICFAAVNSLHNVRICFLEKQTYDFDLTCTMNSDILSLCERSA
jgi:hypothetical protein